METVTLGHRNVHSFIQNETKIKISYQSLPYSPYPPRPPCMTLILPPCEDPTQRHHAAPFRSGVVFFSYKSLVFLRSLFPHLCLCGSDRRGRTGLTRRRGAVSPLSPSECCFVHRDDFNQFSHVLQFSFLVSLISLRYSCFVTLFWSYSSLNTDLATFYQSFHLSFSLSLYIYLFLLLLFNHQHVSTSPLYLYDLEIDKEASKTCIPRKV